MKPLHLTIGALMAAAVANAAPAADALLKSADDMRNPQQDYTVTVKVTDHSPKRDPKVSVFKVLAKGRDSSVVRTLEPRIDRGRILLMNGNDFWGYLPTVSKPIRISLQEKLTGEVANGDLARANFSGDYEPALSGEKTIGGTACHVLKLTAKRDDVTYGKVTLYIEKSTRRPKKAEFYAVSGRLLKTCDYENFRSIGGAVRTTRQIMRDAVREGAYSVLEYSDMKVESLPAKYFTKAYMKRFMD